MSTLLSIPQNAGYDVDRVADLTHAGEREQLSPSAIKAFLRIAGKWELNEVQARGLLGGIVSSTYHAWKTQPAGKKLNQDTLTRVSLLIGIYKSLNIYFGAPWADRWVTLANRDPLFAGKPPIDYMLRDGQPGMMEVRRMLDTWSNGS